MCESRCSCFLAGKGPGASDETAVEKDDPGLTERAVFGGGFCRADEFCSVGI